MFDIWARDASFSLITAVKQALLWYEKKTQQFSHPRRLSFDDKPNQMPKSAEVAECSPAQASKRPKAKDCHLCFKRIDGEDQDLGV